MLWFAISSASSNLFFLELLTGIFPFDRWRKPVCAKGKQNYPVRSRWLARKIFFWPISWTDFDTSGTRFVRKSAQGLFSPWNKLYCQKCSPENIASSRLVAPGSPRMWKTWKVMKFIISISRPGKSLILSEGHGKSWKAICFLRIYKRKET